jgi:hypothetical protein
MNTIRGTSIESVRQKKKSIESSGGVPHHSRRSVALGDELNQMQP